MDKKYLTSFIETKSVVHPKPFAPKKQNPSRETESFFSSSTHKKYIPDEQSSILILNYFQYNNFQDFNTWQQIAKTKTDYKFDERPGQKIDCQLIFKWQGIDKENITIKTSARNKKNAKRKALVQLIEALMSKGLISNGFKEKNFLEKLPRRKKYDSSSSEDENATVSEQNQAKGIFISSLIKENNIESIIDALNADNFLEVWSWALSLKNIDIVQKVLEKAFSKVSNEQINDKQKQSTCPKPPEVMQVSYVGQSKDPFEEDLTVFIRYYQLQRTKYQPKKFSLFPIDPIKSVPLNLPSAQFMNGSDTIKFEAFKEFKSIQQISDQLVKRFSKKSEVKVKRGFFDDLKEIKLPRFEQDITEQKALPVKTLEKTFNQIFYLSQDYPLALKVLQVLLTNLQNVDILFENTKRPQNPSPKESQTRKMAQQYYKEMKIKLLTQMFFNVGLKGLKQNLVKSNTVEGMLNVFSSHTKYDRLFQFTSKEPEEIMGKKVQKKTNFNQFFQQFEFCTEEIVLLVNKLNQKRYIGKILELNQNFKIQVPFLLFDAQIEFPAPFAINKLLNLKLYNKISSSLVHACKNYMGWVDYNLGGGKYVTLIYQTPSGAHLELIQELLAQFIAQKLFILIVSDNYQILSKALTEKGFKCLKMTISSDEKLASKNNIILTNQLNICTDSMKSIAFDRVIIDEAHRIPEIISLMSVIRCTKKMYLIGDPNLPRSQMNATLSKSNGAEKSLFERYLKNGAPYIFTNPVQPNIQQKSVSNTLQASIYDQSIVQWLKESVYGQYFTTDLEVPKRKTPLIKGFNWPSIDYRLCFINVPNQIHTHQTLLNEECFLITWIVAEVLKSGFTELEQITCCCIDSSLIPLLQHHLIKILTKLNIQPLQWQMIFQRLIKPLNGSVWNKNDLIIVLAEEAIPVVKSNEIEQQMDQKEMGKKLNSALLQAERGLIIVGDVKNLSLKSAAWGNFIDWMVSKRLVVTYQIPNLQICG